jgi:hypothetical protein
MAGYEVQQGPLACLLVQRDTGVDDIDKSMICY